MPSCRSRWHDDVCFNCVSHVILVPGTVSIVIWWRVASPLHSPRPLRVTPQNCPFKWGRSGPQSNVGFLDPACVCPISVSSIISCVTNPSAQYIDNSMCKTCRKGSSICTACGQYGPMLHVSRFRIKYMCFTGYVFMYIAAFCVTERYRLILINWSGYFGISVNAFIAQCTDFCCCDDEFSVLYYCCEHTSL